MALVLGRHELRWVLEQCGADRWPYPLRAASWDAETDAETARHRAEAEASLRGRGLLDTETARALLRAGELVAGWRTAVDLVRRAAWSPCAAVVLSDGEHAVALASSEHTDAPVHLAPAPPHRLPETILALVPAVPAGTGGPWPLTRPLAGTTPAPRSPDARADDLLAGADAITDVGVATRAPWPGDPAGDGPAVRATSLVTWVDGPRGRFAVRRGPPGTTRPAVLIGTDDRRLAADIHTVLGDAGYAAAMPGPPTPGRSTA